MKKMLNLKKYDSKFETGEYHLKQLTGIIRDVEISTVAIGIGQETIFLSVLNDVTERNNLRTHVFLNEKLATVGTMAAGIVHEINNPIAWMLGNLNFLQEDLRNLHTRTNNDIVGSELKQKLQEFDDIILESIQGTEKIRKVAKNLKAFARVDDENSLTPVDVHDVLSTAIKMASPEYKYHARLEIDFANDIPLMLMNVGKLYQVFINLIINASQAFKDDDLQKNKIRVLTRKEGERLRIDFNDSGSGISPDIAEKIFDPFFTTKPAGVGTGLGLPICKDIISSMGGEIKVNSLQGKGTTFSVYLPLKPVNKPGMASTPKKTHIKMAHARILVINDEPTLLKTIERVLGKDHDVTAVVGGEAGINILSQQAESFDLIICDVYMADKTGMEVYQYLAANKPGFEERMIFLTNSIDISKRKELLGKIPNMFLEKPFTTDELLRIIQEAMTPIVNKP